MTDPLSHLDSGWPGWRREFEVRGATTATCDRIGRYILDLLKFNRVENLVSRRDPGGEVRQLVLEAIEVEKWLQVQPIGEGPWLDLGSGGGFPGLVFACARPDHAVFLLDRRRGRCDFLRREVRALGLRHVRVLEGEARALARKEPAGSCALVSMKAVAEPALAVALGAPFLSDSGALLLFQRPGWTPPAGSVWRLVGTWEPTEEPLSGRELAAFLLTR